MVVEKNNWVEVEYEGKLKDGNVFDSNKDKEPLAIQAGVGMVIKGFDDALIGMKPGEEKTITIKPEEAYGEKKTEPVELPKTAFSDEIPEVGKEIQIMSNVGPLLIKIESVEEEKIKAVVNHPLAGEELNFNIKLKKILTDEEAEELKAKMASNCSTCDDDCNTC